MDEEEEEFCVGGLRLKGVLLRELPMREMGTLGVGRGKGNGRPYRAAAIKAELLLLLEVAKGTRGGRVALAPTWLLFPENLFETKNIVN